MNTATLVPPTPSPSLNGALAALCRVTYRLELDDAAFAEEAAYIVRSYEPTTQAGPVDADCLVGWFEGLSGDEYFNLAEAPLEAYTNSQRGATWA